MLEFSRFGVRKRSCNEFSLHRKHVYNKKLNVPIALRFFYLPLLIYVLAGKHVLSGVKAENDGSGFALSIDASPLYINEDHLEGISFLQEGGKVMRKSGKFFAKKLGFGDSDSSDSSDSDSDDEDKSHRATSYATQTRSAPFQQHEQQRVQRHTSGDSDDDDSPFARELKRSTFHDHLNHKVSSGDHLKFTQAGEEVFRNFKDLTAPKYTFHPHEKHTFKNVVIERDTDVLDLRQKNGVLSAKFKIGTMDDNSLRLLDHLSKNTASCTVKWVSLSKDKNTGQIHLDCKFDVKAQGYSGDTPIKVKVEGFFSRVLNDINLSTDGMTFHQQFNNALGFKTEVMKALGMDPIHECSIVKVNGKRFKRDEKAFRFMSHLVDNGIKNVIVIVKPSVRLLIHIKRPFSGVIESYTHDAGYMGIKEYRNMLLWRERAEKFCSKITKDDSVRYALVGINDKMMDLNNYFFHTFRDYPTELITVLTFMPYIMVNFYYLEKLVVSKQFAPFHALKNILEFGQSMITNFNKNLNVSNPDYKVYSYSIQGCYEENRDLFLLAKTNGITTMPMIPLSETCTNRDTNVLNLYYLNHRPTMFNFEAEVYGPDGNPISTYKIAMNYDPRARLSYLKEEVLSRLLRDGHLVSSNELFFIKLADKRGQNATDDMLINDVIDVVQEQKTSVPPKFRIAVNPRFDVVYRGKDGGYEKFRIDMNKTNPTRKDFTDAVDAELHEKHLLRPEEHIHTVKLHPRNPKKNKVNFNVDIRSDDQGHFPAGLRADEIAAETDLRMKIPVEFVRDNGKVIKFTINADYGATDDEIERLIRNELRKKGYKKDIPGLHFDVRNSKHNDLHEFWEGGPDVDRFVINTELASDVEVDGDVHGMPFTTHVKVHPRETMDQLNQDVLRRVRQNPKIRVWLDEDPSRESEVYTVVSDMNGRVYDDDELGNNGLYNSRGRIRIGVSDHPFEMIWKNPVTGEEVSFCLSRRPDGRCRPLPPKLVKFPIQDFIDHLIKVMKKEGKYEEHVAKPVRSGRMFTPNIRLKEVRTADGRRYNCAELPEDANFTLLEYAFNLHVSDIRAMVFSLMTADELENLHERQKHNRRYKVVINKDSGDRESHLVTTDDYSPDELRNLIYKNFSSVPSDATIDDLKFYDDSDHEVDYDHFNKRPKENETLRVKFSMKNDSPRPPMPEFDDVVIQPKPYETIRQYFLRAIEEPSDFGLSPMHSYTVVGIDDNGNYVQIDNMLDVPIKDLRNVKKVQFVKKPAVRPDANPEIYYSDRFPDQSPNVVTVEFDSNKESVPSLNSKIRNFLIQVPPEQMGHVTIEADGTKLKCSLETLRDAYMIKNLTLERLMALCQGVDKQNGFNHVKMNLNLSPEEIKKSETYNLLDGLGSPGGSPIANFTLYKGQTDLGLSTLVKVNVGTMNSPVADFYTKMVQMFGDSINNINDIGISLIKNGRMYPCNNSKTLRSLKDFGKATLAKIFQICGLPAVIPENGSYFHFHVSIDLNVSPKSGGATSMGNTVPLDISYDEDDRMTNIHYNENLYPDIASYVNDNPDIDGSNPAKYRVTIRAEEPSHNVLTKTYEMNELPHNLTMHDMFPDTNVHELNITIDSKDGNNLGGWRSETVHPVNDFKSNFDALKRQIILNLKTMHGNALDSLDSYVVKVGINGVKHQCHIENLSQLVSMSLKDFLKNCVNIQNVNNNPSMSFGVGYEPRVKDEKKFNVKVICGDKTVYSVQDLNIKDPIPSELIGKLKAKYGDVMNGIQWGAYINKVQGDCHFTGILDKVDMRSVLSLCGVSDSSVNAYNVVFYDMNYETYKLFNNKVNTNEREGDFPDVLKVSQTVRQMKSPVRISMPYSYQGPDIEVRGEETLNDFVRQIVNKEDEFNPGNPFKIKVHTNTGTFGVDQLPKGVLNHPSRDLNGSVSFIIEDDMEGNDPGTVLNLHFPDKKQTLGDFLIELERNPSNANKKFYFSSKKSFIPSENVPVEILHTPIDELKGHGFFLTVVNQSKSPEKGTKFSVNILSRDGVSASESVGDLQEPLTTLFEKISKNQGNLDKMLGGKFKVIIDGFETYCNLDNLASFQNGMTLDSLLTMCGVPDLDHNHVVTIFFETPISEKSEGLTFNIDLNDKPQGSKNLDYGSEFTVGPDVEEFLKKKKDAHVYLDIQNKDKTKEFVEVDSSKFLQLLSGHPEVVDMLLRLGVPQTHLGDLQSLHLVISNLTKALQGHQSYNIDNGDDHAYDMDSPISKYVDIVELKQKLQENPELRVRGTVMLSDGSKQEFDMRGKDFVHAVDGGQTFREVSLRALSSGDADNVVHVNLSSFEGEEDHTHAPLPKRKVFKKRSSSRSQKKGVLAPSIGSKLKESLGLRRSSEPTSSESSESEGEQESKSQKTDIHPHPTAEASPKEKHHVDIKLPTGAGSNKSGTESGFESGQGSKTPPPGPHEQPEEWAAKHPSAPQVTPEAAHKIPAVPPTPRELYESESNKGSESESERRSPRTMNPHPLSNESVLRNIPLFREIIENPEKKLSMKVKTTNGKVYDLIVRGGMLRKAIEHGNKMRELLEHYLLNDDVDDVHDIEISAKLGSKFTVPLKKHVKVTLPVMASDEPQECDLNDFKNPWNPPEKVWKTATVKSALDSYAEAHNIKDKPKAAYLLNKEDHENLSAEIIFDEDHPQDDAKLNRKIGDDITKGRTLFIRYKDTGELVN
ncbi:hypothetical protein MACJ_002818 [Theileria orientalis]|uniref:Uncharacterized protein n=1 Tax=Theileria orientalis TaxID=68886 RepID=A0A976M6V4_THEOR|nr:hypothetical protein MACJ_002818 [Theileria orientalis]